MVGAAEGVGEGWVGFGLGLGLGLGEEVGVGEAVGLACAEVVDGLLESGK